MADHPHSPAPAPMRDSHLLHAASTPAALRASPLHDEGYSEETQSQPGSDVDMTADVKPLVDHVRPVLREISSLNLDQRLDALRRGAGTLTASEQLDLVKSLVGVLPTWAKQAASAHLDSLMFFDPVKYLPYEMIGIILGHLSPKDLLSASGVNREWRQRTQDEELWRHCFKREGWQVDAPRLRDAEQSAKENGTLAANGSPSGTGIGLQRKDSRKRRAGEAFSDGETSAPAGTSNAVSGGTAQGTEAQSSAGTIRASTGYLPGTTIPANSAIDTVHSRRSSTDTSMSSDSACHTAHSDYKLAPTVFNNNTQEPRVSWAYLYKQRRQLERNWDDGKYQMFRLPHPQFPEQGHTECVYTIQYTGKYLVSGSRDKTIRIWDLDTCKLREPGKPILEGHDASVLCLQFDASPENDIIVSGGSDSYVIIWRFSTGEIINKMTTAHSESVLNLRFDHRYIVTCSKDKNIKIWNRHAIDRDSPLIPAYVLGNFNDPSMPSLIAEHSLLATLTGHGAAVNAVMIHQDTIVSASGDRTIKRWNIHSGRDDKTYIGHTKGIACVQYDGRRIVTGSSDNTVRIFDADRQAEVACLHGHNNLVRTVQARFGDLNTTTDEELQEEATAADNAFFKAVRGGMTPASASRQGHRNAGSSRPEDMLATGTKIPPGGGGGRWAKIVTGSYDETIIIWKKDKDGKWVHRHRLHQDMLLRSRSVSRRHVAPTALPQPANLNAIAAQAGPVAPPAQPAPAAATTTTTTATTTAAPPPQTPAVNPPLPHTYLHPAVQAVQAAAPPQAHHNPINAGANPHHRDRENNRVFKLQFDARRIVCCSQNRVIVGWDFANGQEELKRVGGWSLETY